MVLDVSSLKSAWSALNRSLAYLASELAQDASLREQFRAAAVQGFEFTFELAIKMLKRQLEQMATHREAVGRMTYMEVIRSGAEAGLLRDVARFRIYRDKRNITGHTYDEDKAEEILAVLPEFSEDIRHLLEVLERRNRAAD